MKIAPNQRPEGSNLVIEPSMNSFCVLVVNYHGCKDTVTCVNSILAAAKFVINKIKVVIIDNSCESFDFANEPVHIMYTGNNIGLAGAWYVGFYCEVAQSCDYVIFLNNDAYVAEDFFMKIQKGIETWGPNCAFGPRIYHATDRSLIWSRGGKIQRFAVKIKHFGENVNVSDVKTGDFETGHLSGCCLIMKTAHLNQIGGPDTNFFFRGEEWDLNYRLMQADIHLVILDRVEVFHEINGSHSRFAPNMLYLAYRAKVLFAKKILPWWYFPIWYPLALGYAVTVAPHRFARSSTYSATVIRRALASAFIHGLKNNKILPSKKVD